MSDNAATCVTPTSVTGIPVANLVNVCGRFGPRWIFWLLSDIELGRNKLRNDLKRDFNRSTGKVFLLNKICNGGTKISKQYSTGSKKSPALHTTHPFVMSLCG